MSVWKWKDVALEVDMEDIEFQKKYEVAFQHMEVSEKELQNVGNLSGFSEKYCMLFWNLFDEIFGKGIADKLFDGKMHIGKCEECYDTFIEHCSKQVREINKNRANRHKKYKVKK